MADVFISYSSKESALASELRELLTKAGYSVWMAPESIPAGSDYLREIPRAIGDSRALALLLTRNAEDSAWVEAEVSWAISDSVRVIPLRPDVHEPGEWTPFGLVNVQVRDVSSMEEATAVVRRALGDASAHDASTPPQEDADAVSHYLARAGAATDDDTLFLPPSVLPDAPKLRRGLLGRSLVASLGAPSPGSASPSPEQILMGGGRFLVIGEAGAGKTTFLCQLFRATCRAAAVQPDAALPVLIEAPSLAGERLPELCTRAVSETLGEPVDPTELGAEMVTRGVALFVDGLDECRAPGARAAMLDALGNLSSSEAVRAIVATSRPAEDIAPVGFSTLRLAPLSRDEQVAFLDRYILRLDIGGDGASLLTALPADVRALATRPLFLVLLVVSLAYRGSLPDSASVLFDDYVRALLEGLGERTAPLVERVLCEAAFWCVREARVTIPLDRIAEICGSVRGDPGDIEATILLRRSVLESGILTPARDGACFAHLTLMDHLARNFAADLYSFEPSASLVQYFLRNPEKIELMVGSARVRPGERVAELGAGIGSVARHIPRAGGLTLVELDERLATILRSDFVERRDVTVFQGDAISWLGTHDFDVLFSNLPFFLTDDLLCALSRKDFRVAVLSVPTDASLDEWRERFKISVVEVNEGDDYFPPQPRASQVVRVTPR